MSMLVIKQTEQGYKVKHLFAEYSDVPCKDYPEALNLCRSRCHKILKDDNLVVIKVPFRNMWLVW